MKSGNICDGADETAALSDADLLAAVLDGAAGDGQTAAQQLLRHYGSLRALVSQSPVEWPRWLAVNDAALRRLTAALEIARRVQTYRQEDHPVIHTAEAAAQWMADMRDLTQEQVRLILLDIHNQVIATPTIYIGTLHGVVLRPAEVLREVIARNCPAYILVHNHPAGDPSPSPEDVELTHTLIAAGKLLDIQLLDHLIIAAHGWRSLKQQGLF